MCAGGCKYRKFCCSCLAKKQQPVDMWNTWIILNFNQLRMLEMRSLSFFLFLVLIEQKHLEFWITSLPNLRVYWPMLVCSWHEYDHVHFLSHTCRWEIGIGVSNLQELLPWRYYTNFRKYTHMGNRLKWKRMENSKISLLTLHLFGEINISRKLKIIIRIGKYDIFSTLGGTVML